MENKLYHYGIAGQKWGVRRYQNKDGTLTAAGKKRYDSMSADAKYVESFRNKPVYQLSNDELQKLNKREALEAIYKRTNPSKLKKTIATASSIAAGLGTVSLLYNNGDKIIKIGKEIADKIIKKD